MKKSSILAVVSALCIAGIFGACSNMNGQEQKEKKKQPVQNEKVSISVKGSTADGVTSIDAKVTVSSENSRMVNSYKKLDSYRLRTKVIDGQIYTRLDYDADSEGLKRSILTNNSEAVVIDTDTGSEILRLPVDNQDSNMISSQKIGGRIKFDEVDFEMQKILFDKNMDETGRYAIYNAPSDFLLKSSNSDTQYSSMIIMFDTIDEVFSGTQTVEVKQDGETVTTTMTNLYEVVGEEPVFVGQIIEEEHDIVGEIQLAEDTPDICFESAEEITEDELLELQEEYLTAEVEPVTGDLSDPDYITTTYILYEDVVINSVDDSAFRILLGGK